jgi:hypothetical protein
MFIWRTETSGGIYVASVSLQLIYARNIPNGVCTAPPEDERVVLETCRSS